MHCLTQASSDSLEQSIYHMQLGDVDECGVCDGSGNTCALVLTLRSDTLQPNPPVNLTAPVSALSTTHPGIRFHAAQQPTSTFITSQSGHYCLLSAIICSDKE